MQPVMASFLRELHASHLSGLCAQLVHAGSVEWRTALQSLYSSWQSIACLQEHCHLRSDQVSCCSLAQLLLTGHRKAVLLNIILLPFCFRSLQQLACITGNLNDEEAAEMVQNMQLAAPEVDSVLVELLSTWAERGRDASPRSQVCHTIVTHC